MLWWILAVVITVVVTIAVLYLRDINRAYERINGKSMVISSPFGDIEFSEGGNVTGDPVLVIHGAGGGYDQGKQIAETVLDEQFRWIIPSRFGYLRSALPEDATWDDQAEAYDFLLDYLGVEQTAVVAMSQGGASALLFAANHPERISSLTCISCGVATLASENQAGADRKGNALKWIFTFDFPYWIISKLFKKQFMGLLGVNKDVIAELTPEQLERLGYFINSMNPVSRRSAGVTFDNREPLPGDRIAAIKAPVLIIHARDDMLQLYHNAEFAAFSIPGAELLSYESGGHLLMIVEEQEIKTRLKNLIIKVNDDLIKRLDNHE